MFHWTRTTGLENPQDSMLSDMATALVPITATAWKTAQHFSYGARGFMRVPVSKANDLNYLLGSKTETFEKLVKNIFQLFLTFCLRFRINIDCFLRKDQA
jgi:hypothetical protein